MIYCISDIHGCYDEFMALLEKINFTDKDTLYILGDVIDRGLKSIECLRYVMKTPNVHMIMGNHEQMMFYALTSDYGEDGEPMDHWLRNGADKTLAEFSKLQEEELLAIMDFINNLPYLYQVKIGEQNYVLVHAGLNVMKLPAKDRASTARVLPQQNLHDLVWIRKEFFRKKALPKSITVFGHTPIPNIQKHNGAKVWRDKRFNDKICIDGGCVFGGNLLALRLDDMAEFAVNAPRNFH